MIDDYGEPLQQDPNKSSWQQFKRITKKEIFFNRLIHQVKLSSFQTLLKYKFCYEVFQDIAHSMRLDEAADTRKWQIANNLGQDQPCGFTAFHNKRKIHISKIP